MGSDVSYRWSNVDVGWEIIGEAWLFSGDGSVGAMGENDSLFWIFDVFIPPMVL